MHQSSIYAEEIKGKAYDRKILMRFAGYVLPYRAAILAVLVILPLVAICRLAQPWIIKVAIDEHIITGRMNGLEITAIFFIAILLTESMLSYLEVFLLQSIGQKVMAGMREELFRHVMKLPVPWFDRTATGGIVTRMTSDVEVLGEMFASGIITIIGDILLLAGIIMVMLWMNPKLSLATFSILPFLCYLAWFFRRKMRQSFREVRARLGILNSFLAECISGITIIQVFNRQRDEQRSFSELNSSYRNANMPVIFWDASLYAIVEALSSVAVALVIWYGGREILSGALTFGVLVAFIQYIEKFFTPIRDLSAKYSVMQGAMAALERIFNLLDTETAGTGRTGLGTGDQESAEKDLKTATEFQETIQTGKSQVTATFNLLPVPDYSLPSPEPRVPGPDIPLIRIEDISFAYRKGENALEQFSLSVNRGEKIALVGESGGGKTTITRLLTRMYEIDKGSIRIDGLDIGSIAPCELRKRVGIVMQDPCLFAGSIEFNISLGDEEAVKRVREAAAIVGADHFIERLPLQYAQQVSEHGSNLSVGEKQLISFARAVAFNPEILVLDEATASIDTRSEQLIKEGLKGLMLGRTAIIIAHRLSTIQDADRIVVVHRGRKVEEGTHRQLMRSEGFYYRLHSLQFN